MIEIWIGQPRRGGLGAGRPYGEGTIRMYGLGDSQPSG